MKQWYEFGSMHQNEFPLSLFENVKYLKHRFGFYELWYFCIEFDSMETEAPMRRLVKEVTGVVRDGLSQLPVG
jgi:hypothetical protein